jgi:hypothetical protein
MTKRGLDRTERTMYHRVACGCRTESGGELELLLAPSPKICPRYQPLWTPVIPDSAQYSKEMEHEERNVFEELRRSWAPNATSPMCAHRKALSPFVNAFLGSR